MQLPPLPQLICADRVMADSSSSLNFREFSVHEEVPMMPALPFVQVIVSLSSDFNALSLTVTVALVTALLAAKALLKNFSSYSPAGKGVDVFAAFPNLHCPNRNVGSRQILRRLLPFCRNRCPWHIPC